MMYRNNIRDAVFLIKKTIYLNVINLCYQIDIIGLVYVFL